MKQKINIFIHKDTESIYQAWKRLSVMVRKYPHNEIPDPDIFYIFYRVLEHFVRNVIDLE